MKSNMRRALLMGLMLALCVPVSRAQEQNQELERLTSLVLHLKEGGQQAYNEAVDLLAADSLWTPLNDFRDRAAQWMPTAATPRFQLNKILGAAQNRVRYEASNKTMLNGEDPRYQYSLYERGVQAGRVFSCDLLKREGRQVFVLIPYDGASAQLTLTVANDTFRQKRLPSGVITCEGTARPGEALRVEVTNGSDRGQFFVLINYNSRR